MLLILYAVCYILYTIHVIYIYIYIDIDICIIVQKKK